MSFENFMVKLEEIKDIVKIVTIVVAIVFVLFLIFAEAGLKSEPMTEAVYEVVDYEKVEDGYSVDYLDDDGEPKNVLCKTMVQGDTEEVRVNTREYWGFKETDATLVLLK